MLLINIFCNYSAFVLTPRCGRFGLPAGRGTVSTPVRLPNRPKGKGKRQGTGL